MSGFDDPKRVGAIVFDRIVRLLFQTSEAPPLPERRIDDPQLVIDYDDERIPEPARERVRMILALLLEVEVALRREVGSSSSSIDVARMRDIYLPSLVKSYMDIPVNHRSEIFRRTGKSASFVLVDSLDQMLRHLRTTLHNLARHDIDAFTTNIGFIAQKFADGEDAFR